MQTQKTMSLVSAYSMLLAALGLGMATHQRGENLSDMVRVAPQQQISPATPPKVIISRKSKDLGIL